MKFSAGVAVFATAIVTTAAQLVAAQIKSDTTWMTSPFIAFFGAIIVTLYAYKSLNDMAARVPRPDRIMTVLGAIILLVTLLPVWLGGRESGFKIQMTAQIVALVACLIGLLPPLVRARNSADTTRSESGNE